MATSQFTERDFPWPYKDMFLWQSPSRASGNLRKPSGIFGNTAANDIFFFLLHCRERDGIDDIPQQINFWLISLNLSEFKHRQPSDECNFGGTIQPNWGQYLGLQQRCKSSTGLFRFYNCRANTQGQSCDLNGQGLRLSFRNVLLYFKFWQFWFIDPYRKSSVTAAVN